MRTRALHQITLLITLVGCCATHSIDIETFSASPLAAQIREYERARREHCVPHENRGILISEMGNHGKEAATAMCEILKHPSVGFPPEDAIDVLESVYRLGIDLRDPETLHLLSSIEATSSDWFVRARAKDALWRMRTYAPGELQPPEINGRRIERRLAPATSTPPAG
jgi:hypothetical protein